ncbi:MAG: ankyrin repeat domain-containing protein [Bacteroidales bacterium]|jgi:ankyrin repeat protein|nr:ankyrin repeat domain-containing protein [Bacteroidales bacterium]
MEISKIYTRMKVMVILIIAGMLFSTSLFSQEASLLNKVGSNDIDAVKSLIAAGADLNQVDDIYGYTPLMHALNGCKNEMAKFLIEKGADINIKSNDGTTALTLACGCSEEIAKQLLAKGADIKAVSDKGMGAFTQCTGVGLSRGTVSYEFAEFLLEKGANIDETNTTDYYGGYTPLFWAVEDNNEELVSFLIKHGANVNARSNKGKTPLSIATEAGYKEIAEILKSGGAK